MTEDMTEDDLYFIAAGEVLLEQLEEFANPAYDAMTGKGLSQDWLGGYASGMLTMTTHLARVIDCMDDGTRTEKVISLIDRALGFPIDTVTTTKEEP